MGHEDQISILAARMVRRGEAWKQVSNIGMTNSKEDGRHDDSIPLLFQ